MSLWKKLQSFWLISIGSPRTRSYKLKQLSIGTSFCTCKQATLTVEAAIVIPLTAGFLATILFLFRVLQVQAFVDEAVMYAGRKTAVESSFITSEEALFVSAEAFLLVALEENEVVEQYVENGVLGISLFASEFREKEFTLRANYSVTLPIGFFGVIKIPLYSQNLFQKWTGDGYVNEGETWVYITQYGTAYHASGECQALELSVQETTLSEIDKLRGANGQKYYVCSNCKEKRNEDKVYYTDYGTLYHGDISCSALKRIISKVPISQVGDRSECSFCY